jgi:hypothetical protein
MEKPVEYLSSTVDTVTGSLDKNMGWLNDKTITNVAILGLIVYASFFIGKIWPKGMDMFKHPLVKVVSFMLVAYIATKNPALALVAAIALITIMMTNLKNTKEFLTSVSPNKLTTDDDVYEAIMGRCVCRCDTKGCKCDCKDEIPEDLDISQITSENEQQVLAEEEQQVMAEELPEIMAEQVIEQGQMKQSDMDKYQEMNQNALENIRNQIKQHDMDIQKSKVSSCNTMPYYRKNTPFRSWPWPYFNPKLTKSTLDADYEPINFN